MVSFFIFHPLLLVIKCFCVLKLSAFCMCVHYCFDVCAVLYVIISSSIYVCTMESANRKQFYGIIVYYAMCARMLQSGIRIWKIVLMYVGSLAG